MESVSKEEIKLARQTDLAEYLISKGIPLQKVGHRYKHKEHDSLVFTKNSFFWNSRQEHGNALDYATKHLNMDFTSAVKELSQFNSRSPVQPVVEQSFKLKDIELNPNMQRAVAYLNKTRKLDYSIIQNLIKNKLLFQSKDKANVVFPIKDEKENTVGAELNGTLSDLRFKGIAESSQYGYGFNMKTSETKDLKHYLFFESSIDMLSYINIQQDKGNLERLKQCLFVSMGGLKLNIVQGMLNHFKNENKPNVCLCVDNDDAGRNFCDLVIKELGNELGNENIKTITPREGKDWNEQLKHIKEVGRQHMKIDLNREQANELQSLCIDISSKEKRLPSLNPKILDLAEKAENELSITTKNIFELDKDFIPVLKEAAEKEKGNLDKVIKSFKEEISTMKGYSKESQEAYISNLTKRKDHLLKAIEKLSAPKKNLEQRLEDAKKKLLDRPKDSRVDIKQEHIYKR